MSIKKQLFFTLALITVVLGGSSYLIFRSYQLLQSSPSPAIQSLVHLPPSPSLIPSPAASPIISLSLPPLEELKTKTINWTNYENKEHKIKVKYPSDWSYIDDPSLLNRLTGIYKEILEIGKSFAYLQGVKIDIFYTDDISKIPSKESIVKDFLTKKWEIKPEMNFFSLNDFEGIIAVIEGNEARNESASAYRKFDNRVYYINWWLYEEFRPDKPRHSDIAYQNQFLPFLASFEIIE